MRLVPTLVVLALLAFVPSAAAREDVTVDVCFAADCWTTCPADVNDGEAIVPGVDAGLPVIEADVPGQEIRVPDSTLFVPGFYLEMGEDRVIESEYQEIEIAGATAWVGAHERYDPSEGRAVEYEGARGCVMTNG